MEEPLIILRRSEYLADLEHFAGLVLDRYIERNRTEEVKNGMQPIKITEVARKYHKRPQVLRETARRIGLELANESPMAVYAKDIPALLEI